MFPRSLVAVANKLFRRFTVSSYSDRLSTGTASILPPETSHCRSQCLSTSESGANDEQDPSLRRAADVLARPSYPSGSAFACDNGLVVVMLGVAAKLVAGVSSCHVVDCFSGAFAPKTLAFNLRIFKMCDFNSSGGTTSRIIAPSSIGGTSSGAGGCWYISAAIIIALSNSAPSRPVPRITLARLPWPICVRASFNIRRK